MSELMQVREYSGFLKGVSEEQISSMIKFISGFHAKTLDTQAELGVEKNLGNFGKLYADYSDENSGSNMFVGWRDFDYDHIFTIIDEKGVVHLASGSQDTLAKVTVRFTRFENRELSISNAIEKICHAANAAQKVPELGEQVTQVCIGELQRVIEILGIDGGIEIKKRRKPGITQFEDLLSGNHDDFIRAVYLDITQTNYPRLRGINRKDLFILTIVEYYRLKKIKFSQKKILEAIQPIHSMSPNTISQVLSRKQNGKLGEEMGDFIEAYISGEEPCVLEIEEIY